MLAACTCAAQTNPGGATVVRGSATFSTTGNTLTVTNTPNTLINWQSFSIPAGQRTHFEQQGATSTVLNRVTGSSPSEILGQMTSNGRVVLINPNGVVFGAGSQINVSGLIASALPITEPKLLAGDWQFVSEGGAEQLTSRGTITSTGNQPVILIGRMVTQESGSTINNDPFAHTWLAAGQTIRVPSFENPALMVEARVPENRVVFAGSVPSGSLRIWDALRFSYRLAGGMPLADDSPDNYLEIQNWGTPQMSAMIVASPHFQTREVTNPDGSNSQVQEGIAPLALVQPLIAPRPQQDMANQAANNPSAVQTIFVGRPPAGVQPVDQPANSALKESFYRQLVNRSPEEVNAYWNKFLTSSSVQRPKSFATEEETIRYLETTPNAIGYIDDSKVTKRLRIVYRFPE